METAARQVALDRTLVAVQRVAAEHGCEAAVWAWRPRLLTCWHPQTRRAIFLRVLVDRPGAMPGRLAWVYAADPQVKHGTGTVSAPPASIFVLLAPAHDVTLVLPASVLTTHHEMRAFGTRPRTRAVSIPWPPLDPPRPSGVGGPDSFFGHWLWFWRERWVVLGEMLTGLSERQPKGGDASATSEEASNAVGEL